MGLLFGFTPLRNRTYQVVHDASHVVGDLALLGIGVVREDLVYGDLGRHEQLRLGTGNQGTIQPPGASSLEELVHTLLS